MHHFVCLPLKILIMERIYRLQQNVYKAANRAPEAQTLTGLSSRDHHKKPISNAFKPNQPTRPAEIFKLTFREKAVAPRCLP